MFVAGSISGEIEGVSCDTSAAVSLSSGTLLVPGSIAWSGVWFSKELVDVCGRCVAWHSARHI